MSIFLSMWARRPHSLFASLVQAFEADSETFTSTLSETIALSVVGWRWRLAPEAQAGQTVEVQTAVVDYKDQNWSCVTSLRAALGSEEAVHPTQPSRQITELLARRKKWATVQILLQNTSCRLLQSQPHSSRLWNVTTWEHYLLWIFSCVTGSVSLRWQNQTHVFGQAARQSFLSLGMWLFFYELS